MEVPREIVLMIVNLIPGRIQTRWKSEYVYMHCDKCGGSHEKLIETAEKIDHKDVETAKSLRLVSSQFASAYSSIYIHVIIGGSIRRRQNKVLISTNARLMRSYFLVENSKKPPVMKKYVKPDIKFWWVLSGYEPIPEGEKVGMIKPLIIRGRKMFW